MFKSRQALFAFKITSLSGLAHSGLEGRLFSWGLSKLHLPQSCVTLPVSTALTFFTTPEAKSVSAKALTASLVVSNYVIGKAINSFLDPDDPASMGFMVAAGIMSLGIYLFDECFSKEKDDAALEKTLLKKNL